MRTRLLLSLLVPAVVATAVPAVPAVADRAAAEARSSGAASRVVVAVIDSPANPYHEAYHATPDTVTADVLAEFGIDEAHTIRLTRTGDFAADFAKDRAQFDAIRRGEPYWFEGTNVIGISFVAADRSRLRPDGTGSAHGVGTTSAVLAANPEAVVVSVEAPSAPVGVPGFGSTPLGEEWAFNHPAVDIVSTSYGPPYSPPLGYHLTDSHDGVVVNGKIHVGASDNSPALSPVDATSGPWWTIGVAGYGEGSTEGKTVRSGSLPDVVADFTQTLPYCRSCEAGTSTVSGTSFATPRTAGTLSKVLLEARRAAGHTGGIVTAGASRPLMVQGRGLSLTNWQLRRALERGATYPTTASYAPGTNDAPVPDAAPWALTGWGAVTTDPRHRVVEETLAALGVSGTATRTKSAQACRAMTENVRARHLYWDRVAAFSQSAGSTQDPFLYC